MIWDRHPGREEGRHHRATSLPSVDPETGWFRSWYFMSRLAESLVAARERDLNVTLVYLRLPLSAWSITNRLRLYLTLRLSLLQHEAQSPLVYFGRLSEDDFVICLMADPAAAERNCIEVERRVRDLGCETSRAAFPADGDDPYGLLETALKRLEHARTGAVRTHRCRQQRHRRAA